MKSISISGFKREVVGKKEANRLRAEGQVPCVIYGGDEAIHFYASAKDFKSLIYTPNVYLVDVNIDGTTYQAIIKDSQYHPVTDELIHVDFLRVYEDKPVKVEVPIRIEGYAVGLRKGGKLKSNLRTLRIKALPKYLPDTITINVESLDLNQSIRVGALKMENIEFLNAKAVPVVAVEMTRAARSAAKGGKG
jgi:large subunit ribosomal protein L25